MRAVCQCHSVSQVSLTETSWLTYPDTYSKLSSCCVFFFHLLWFKYNSAILAMLLSWCPGLLINSWLLVPGTTFLSSSLTLPQVPSLLSWPSNVSWSCSLWMITEVSDCVLPHSYNNMLHISRNVRSLYFRFSFNFQLVNMTSNLGHNTDSRCLENCIF